MNNSTILKDKKVNVESKSYIDLNTIYHTDRLESINYRIDRVQLTPTYVRNENILSIRNKKSWMTEGLQSHFTYVRLYKKGNFMESGVMMSDTPMERNSNQKFIDNANGNVLIFGLGLGLIILPLLECENVKSITVVELYSDLIRLVEPIIKKHDKTNKLNIVHADCFKYHDTISKHMKFDCIYGDIWKDISTDNLKEMKTLTKNWKPRLNKENPNSFIDHWLQDYLKKELRKEKRQEKTSYFNW